MRDMSEPCITVLIPVYNAELYLKQAIDSVLSQTFTDFELLIINDGSTDSSLDILHSYSDDRLRIISQSNAGIVKALNLGLDLAKGKYIARMDADDICYPHRLSTQFNFLQENPDYIGVGSNVNWIDKEGDYIFTFINPSSTYEEIKRSFMKDNPFIHPSMFFLKDEAIAVGKYPNLLNFEDYGLWKKLLDRGKMCNLNEVLLDYRMNPSSVSIDEKDLGKEFALIKRKALMNGKLSDEDQKILSDIIKSFSYDQKEISYKRMLAKKFLWNNYQPKKSRKNLLFVIKKEPFRLYNYGMYFFSFFPEKIIRMIYQKIKS